MIDYDTLPNPTNAQLLQLARSEYAKALQALNIGKGDRRLDRQRVADIQTQILWLTELVNAETGLSSDGGVSFAGFKPTV